MCAVSLSRADTAFDVLSEGLVRRGVLRGALSVVGGRDHTLALLEDGSITTWVRLGGCDFSQACNHWCFAQLHNGSAGIID
jgi:hypothetical protein